MEYLINMKMLACLMILPIYLGSMNTDFLDTSDTCMVANGVCETRCRCNEGFTNVNLTCLAKVDSHCSNSSECIPNAECSVTDRCVCKSGFTSNSNDTECRLKVGAECNVTSDQLCIKNAECDVMNGTANTCTCRKGYSVYDYNTTCSGNVGATCAETDDCIKQADCMRNTCTCGSLYTSAADNLTCIGYVGAVCNEVTSTCVTDAACIYSHCKCKDGYYGDKTCEEIVDGLLLPIWAIVVIVVGGSLVVLIVIVVLVKCCGSRRRRNSTCICK